MVKRRQNLHSTEETRALTTNPGAFSKHMETTLMQALSCLNFGVCYVKKGCVEYISVSRFKQHTLKFLKPDKKLHLKLFSASILLMRGATENRTSHLVEKEKWKPKSGLCFRLNEVLRGTGS